MGSEEINREEQLRKLQQFTQNTDKQLSELLESFGWSEASIQNLETPIVCPFNSSHRLLSAKRLEAHLEHCQWKAEGYDDHDMPLSTPSVPPESHSCIKFDEKLQENVLLCAKEENPSMKIGAGTRLIPRTSDRLCADFTTDERRALYEYVVANTIEPDIGDDIGDLNKPQKQKDNKSLSYQELAAQERNLKRRRAKHRGVHTNKKTHTEIFREVISQQMEMLAEHITEQNDQHNEIVEDKSNYYEKSNTPHQHIDIFKGSDRSYRPTYDKYDEYQSYKSHSESNRDNERSRSRRKEYERTKHSSKSSKDTRRDYSEERKSHKSHKRTKHRHHEKHKRRRSHSSSSKPSKKSKHRDRRS